MVSYNHKSKQWLVGVEMKFFLALDKEKASSVTVVCDKVTPMVEKTQQKKIRGTPPFFFLKEKNCVEKQYRYILQQYFPCGATFFVI